MASRGQLPFPSAAESLNDPRYWPNNGSYGSTGNQTSALNDRNSTTSCDRSNQQHSENVVEHGQRPHRRNTYIGNLDTIHPNNSPVSQLHDHPYRRFNLAEADEYDDRVVEEDRSNQNGSNRRIVVFEQQSPLKSGRPSGIRKAASYPKRPAHIPAHQDVGHRSNGGNRASAPRSTYENSYQIIEHANQLYETWRDDSGEIICSNPIQTSSPSYSDLPQDTDSVPPPGSSSVPDEPGPSGWHSQQSDSNAIDHQIAPTYDRQKQHLDIASQDIISASEAEKRQADAKANRERERSFIDENGERWHQKSEDETPALAIQHCEIADRLRAAADKLGSYRHAPEAGKNDNDRLSFVPAHADWGKDWAHRPDVLFEFYKPRDRAAACQPRRWIYEGRRVVNHNGRWMWEYDDVPATISSAIEGWRMEAYYRRNPSLNLEDIQGRLPINFSAKIKATQGDHGVWAASTLGNRHMRWRWQACLISWTREASDPVTRNFMEKLLDDADRRNHSIQSWRELNSTRVLGRDLTSDEKNELQRRRKQATKKAKDQKKEVKEAQKRTNPQALSSSPQKSASDHVAAIFPLKVLTAGISSQPRASTYLFQGYDHQDTQAESLPLNRHSRVHREAYRQSFTSSTPYNPPYSVVQDTTRYNQRELTTKNVVGQPLRSTYSSMIERSGEGSYSDETNAFGGSQYQYRSQARKRRHEPLDDDDDLAPSAPPKKRHRRHHPSEYRRSSEIANNAPSHGITSPGLLKALGLSETVPNAPRSPFYQQRPVAKHRMRTSSSTHRSHIASPPSGYSRSHLDSTVGRAYPQMSYPPSRLPRVSRQPIPPMNSLRKLRHGTNGTEIYGFEDQPLIPNSIDDQAMPTSRRKREYISLLDSDDDDVEKTLSKRQRRGEMPPPPLPGPRKKSDPVRQYRRRDYTSSAMDSLHSHRRATDRNFPRQSPTVHYQPPAILSGLITDQNPHFVPATNAKAMDHSVGTSAAGSRQPNTSFDDDSQTHPLRRHQASPCGWAFSTQGSDSRPDQEATPENTTQPHESRLDDETSLKILGESFSVGIAGEPIFEEDRGNLDETQAQLESVNRGNISGAEQASADLVPVLDQDVCSRNSEEDTGNFEVSNNEQGAAGPSRVSAVRQSHTDQDLVGPNESFNMSLQQDVDPSDPGSQPNEYNPLNPTPIAQHTPNASVGEAGILGGDEATSFDDFPLVDIDANENTIEYDFPLVDVNDNENTDAYDFSLGPEANGDELNDIENTARYDIFQMPQIDENEGETWGYDDYGEHIGFTEGDDFSEDLDVQVDFGVPADSNMGQALAN